MCARRSRPARGARAGTWCHVAPVFPFPCRVFLVSPSPPRVSRAVCGGPSRLGVPYPRLLVRHSTRSVPSASSVRLPFWYSPHALCVCVRSRSRGVRFPPPLPWLVWRPHLGRSRRWALVGQFHAVGAPPRVLPRSLAPFGVLEGGLPGPVSPLPGLGLCAPLWGGSARLGGWGRGGGRLFAAPPVCAAGAASGAGGRSASIRPSAFPGQATKRVSLASFWSWRAWPPHRSGSCPLAVCGRGPCGALARWRGFACSPRLLWEQAAGAGGRALLWPPSRAPRSRQGEAGPSPLPQGLRAGAPAAYGPMGGVGGGVAPRPPCFPSGGRPAVPQPAPSLVVGAFPPRRARLAGVAGPPVAPVAACLGGGGGGREPLPRGPRRTQPLPPPSPSGQHCGCHWRCSGHGGHGPHTVLVRRCVPPPGVVCASLQRAGAGSPVGCDPRGERQRGAPGRAACGSSCAPPPRCGPFWGRGGRPLSAPGGRRVVAPAACRPGGEPGGGRPLRYSPPPCPVRCRPVMLLPPAHPPGLYSCCGGCWAAVGVGRGPVGRQWVSAAGGGRGGGVISSPWSAPPPSPGRPLSGLLRTRLPGCRRSVVVR